MTCFRFGVNFLNMNSSEDSDYQEYLKKKRETEEYYEGLEVEMKTQQLLAERDKINDLIENIKEFNPEALLADGLDHALIGYSSKGHAIYSIDKIVSILVERDGMSKEEAKIFFDFNIDGAHMGEYTPIYIYQD